MTTTMSVQCPHCGAANESGGQFCQSCGKALPSTVATGPRIVGTKEFATTSAGQKLQGDQLQVTAKRASGALLAVAIIQSIVPALLVALVAAAKPSNTDYTVVYVIIGSTAAVFWGLYFWSRKQPLPAAIVGLVLYGTLVAINVVSSVQNLSANGPGNGFGGIGIGWLDIVIMVVLGKAISAGVKHRQLMKQSTAL